MQALSGRFDVVVGAGTLRLNDAAAVHFPHRWTPGGVAVSSDFTAAHLLHLAAAGVLLNDLYREAHTATRQARRPRCPRDPCMRAHGHRYAFCQTETCALLALVNGSRFQSLQRSRRVIPASRAMRSSSEGHTYR